MAPDTEVTCQLSPTEDGQKHFFAMLRKNQDDGTTLFQLVCGDPEGLLRGFTCPNHKWPNVFTNRPSYEPELIDSNTKAFLFSTGGSVTISYKCRSR